MVLRLNTPNRSRVAYTRPPPLEACYRRPRPPGRQVFQSLRSTCSTVVLTRSTRSLPCTLALADVPRCQPPLLVTRSSSSSVQASRSIGTAHPYLTFTSPSTTISELHTCASKARDMFTTQLTPWLVHKLNPRRKSR